MWAGHSCPASLLERGVKPVNIELDDGAGCLEAICGKLLSSPLNSPFPPNLLIQLTI